MPSIHHEAVLLVAEAPVLGIVVEVQLGRKADKRLRWPQYLAGLRAQLGCPCCLLVVAPTQAMARWCAAPIELGHPGFVLRPLVVGPDLVPVVTDEQQAQAHPELAVLSAMAHGQGARGLDAALAALAGAARLDDDRAALYYDLVAMSLGEAARHALEAMMDSGRYEFRSEFSKRHIALGEAKGRAEGEVKGKAEGEAKGKAEGKAEAVLTVLRARGLAVSEAVERQVRECTDLARLDAWLKRVVNVKAAEELLD